MTDQANMAAAEKAERWQGAMVFAALVATTIAGAVTGALIHLGLLLPTIGYGQSEVQRIVGLSQWITSVPPEGEHTVICIGNSISVEGYDGRQIVEAAPGWRAWNLAINGGDPNELLLMLPSVLRLRPDAVVLTLRPTDLGVSTGIATDKAYAYAIAGIPALHDAPLDAAALEGTSERSIQALSASPLRARLHFRGMLLNRFNEQVRTRLRSEIRSPDPLERYAPYHMTGSIDGAALDRHFAVVSEQHAQRLSRGTSGRAQIRRLAREIREAGSMPVLVIAPRHPAMPPLDDDRAARELHALLTELAGTYNGLLIDASEALSAEDFADAIHPNQSGRRRLSHLVGAALPAPPPEREP